MRVLLSILMITFLISTNVYAADCSDYVNEAKLTEPASGVYIDAVNLAVDRCIVEAQNRSMKNVVQQLMNDTMLCLETSAEQTEIYEATCNLKVVDVASWVLKHN